MKRKIGELQLFDPAEYLTDNEEIAAYLTVVIEESDAALLKAALGDVSRASKKEHLGDGATLALKATQDILNADGDQLSVTTVNRVCAAVGFRLVVQPVLKI